MKAIRNQLACLAVIALLLTGCRRHHADPMTVAHVRVIDAVPGPARLNFALNGHAWQKRVDFAADSGYANVDPGNYTLWVNEDGLPDSAADISGAMDAGSAYTILALPHGADGMAVRLKAVRERWELDNPKNRATVRFIAAAPEYSRLSLALDNIIAIDAQRYSTESTSLSLAPGNYALKLWTGDDGTALLGPTPIHVDAGRAYTLVAMGRRSDGTLTVQLYEDGN